ncbi:MAG: hypothetical protein R8G33_11430 [Gammaproteobacteria bacterium]|nr:hypothetical protein [Gammaproteobacteria bacterium]
MSKEDQRPVDSLEEEYSDSSESITSAKKTDEEPGLNSDSDKLNLEDIRTAGF